MKLLPLLAVAILLGSCAFPGETDPFRARQQWQVTGRNGETRVDVVVGAGWLLESQGSVSQPPRQSFFSNKQLVFGTLTMLLRSETTPTLILDPERHEGTLLWNAGQPGNIYGCSFSFNRGVTRFGGELVKHLQTQDMTVSTCTTAPKCQGSGHREAAQALGWPP